MKAIRVLFPCIALAFVASAFASGSPVEGFPPALQPADLVLRDATIATLDPLQPEARALAIRDGKILAVGGNESISRYVGKRTKVM
ncbi:MAG TPA: amidohydrolase, partial [Rhodanobacteraceae bacterium]|nr:amidohydrolase [Rhodanobacteraceae bacterium]